MQTTTHEKESAICEGAQTADTDTSQTETTSSAIDSQYRPSVKEFETVRAQMALRARTLTAKPNQNGLTLWEVGKWGQILAFSHWNYVLALRAQIGG